MGLYFTVDIMMTTLRVYGCVWNVPWNWLQEGLPPTIMFDIGGLWSSSLCSNQLIEDLWEEKPRCFGYLVEDEKPSWNGNFIPLFHNEIQALRPLQIIQFLPNLLIWPQWVWWSVHVHSHSQDDAAFMPISCRFLPRTWRPSTCTGHKATTITPHGWTTRGFHEGYCRPSICCFLTTCKDQVAPIFRGERFFIV